MHKHSQLSVAWYDENDVYDMIAYDIFRFLKMLS